MRGPSWEHKHDRFLDAKHNKCNHHCDDARHNEPDAENKCVHALAKLQSLSPPQPMLLSAITES
jgi:hypothetical protein